MSEAIEYKLMDTISCNCKLTFFRVYLLNYDLKDIFVL